ncbi:GNAT family N-acetyltransferase [Paenibacillus oenotherae]|uniref:GNAT family N-acetyltransferase n=1 Tax=Paenibacillus oenotherae TaxID=1435645 RepID=A0ABS7D4H9_9BACL|nr:GNAT family N-acetyltransferase [Paenibacillus oenotherae]MBW7474795.1 GNAT family N-acetyltransferase [Paenibacillus oenotherae]
MPTIIAKPFDQDIQTQLGEIQSAYHAAELSKKDKSDIPEEIYIIEAEGAMVGYGVVWEYDNGKPLIHKAEKDYFHADEKYLEKDFYIAIKNETDFVFIEVLDVLKEHEGKGYAAYFINWLKAKYPNKKMYVYTLDKSRNFWYKQGFEVVGDTIWMSYP